MMLAHDASSVENSEKALLKVKLGFFLEGDRERMFGNSYLAGTLVAN